MKNFQKLLRGSAVINQMLADIDQVTKSMIGMIDGKEFSQSFVMIECGRQHYWRIDKIARFRNRVGSVCFGVEFWVKADPHRLIYSTIPVSQREPTLEDTPVTWNALEDLVAYFLQFRSFSEKSKPLFDAAKTSMTV